VYVRGVRDGDTLTIGRVPAEAPILLPAENWIARWGAASRDTTAGPWRYHALELEESLPNSWNETDSFAGLWPGGRHVWGIPYQVASDAEGRPRATMKPLVVDAGPAAKSLYVFFAPRGPQAAVTIQSPQGSWTKTLSDGGLAWVSWPPCFHQKIVVVEAAVPLAGRVTITPVDAHVLAVTSLSDTAEQARVAGLLATARAQYRATLAREQTERALREVAARVPPDRIAILPTGRDAAAGPVVKMLHACGLIRRCRQLTPADVLDPTVLNARRFPVLLNLGGEDYLATIRREGDGAEAILAYLRSGGLLAMLSSQPLPFCYDISSGDPVGRPLTPRMSFPIGGGFEHPPADDLQLIFPSRQQILSGLPGRLSFLSEGDLRLRTVRREAVAKNAEYTPLATVVRPGGEEFGDAAAYAKFVRGEFRGGRILYVWSGLSADPRVGPSVIGDVIRFLVAEAAH
jgi:hypothetical protein